MEILNELINLFFIPMISLHILQKENRRAKYDIFDKLMLYGTMVVCNQLISECIIYVLNIIFDLDFSRDGMKYGVLSFFVAVCISCAVIICKKYVNLSLEITKRNEET